MLSDLCIQQNNGLNHIFIFEKCLTAAASYVMHQNVLKQRMNKFAKIAFHLFCCFAASSMTIRVIIRCFKNEDISSINYRQFNHLPRDKYPTFSICLKGHHSPRGIYDEHYLKKYYGMDGQKYGLLLSGQNYRGGNGSTDIFNIDYQNAIMSLQKILVSYQTNLDNGSVIDQWHKCDSCSAVFDDMKLPLYISYVDFTTICFTRKTVFLPSLIRRYDYIGTIQ